MRTTILVALALIAAHGAAAQQLVTYKSTNASGQPIEVAGTLTLSATPLPPGTRGPAAILIHSGWGWETPTTAQYAKALSAAGYTVLEPRIFPNDKAPAPRQFTVLQIAYDGLAFLAAREDVDPKRVGIAGFSYGGAFALHAAAAWAQAAHGTGANLRFAAHAPFYPVCWVFTAFAQGKRKTPGLADDAFTKWTGAPVRIFAGGKDDYDDKDPAACQEFVSTLPAEYRPAFSVRVYPEATHGWDQDSARFFVNYACKGRGCWNINQSNAEVTRMGIRELIEFFDKTLSSSSRS